MHIYTHIYIQRWCSVGSPEWLKTKTLFEDSIRWLVYSEASIGPTPVDASDASIRPDASIDLKLADAFDASIRPDASIGPTLIGASGASIRDAPAPLPMGTVEP